MARGPMAGAAGPGKFSKRTDGLEFKPDTYGQGVEQAAIKAGAPLARTADVRGLPAGEVRAAAQEAVTPLFAPSQRPDEPITSGIAMGEGPGPEVLGGARPAQKLSDTLAQLLPFDDTGDIAILYQEALARGN
jgi:hypothetical protein